MNRWCQPGGRHHDSDSRPHGSGDHGASKGGSKGGSKGRGRHQKSWKGRGRGSHQPNQSRGQPEWSGDEDMSMLQLKKAATCLS